MFDITLTGKNKELFSPGLNQGFIGFNQALDGKSKYKNKITKKGEKRIEKINYKSKDSELKTVKVDYI